MPPALPGRPTLQQIAAELGTSRPTVWLALHGARVAVGAGGGARSSDGPPRVLADELYADPQIVGVLQAHQAQLFEPKAWRRAGRGRPTPRCRWTARCFGRCTPTSPWR